MNRIAIHPGTLWARIVACSNAALRSGAIFPIPTTATLVEQQGIRFLVRVVANLERKARDRPPELVSRTDFNPFLPYDERMYVGDVSESHVCLLNKFNVLDHHALIVTRAYEAQDALLTLLDFDALWRGMREFASLGFYNAGAAAGASQHHKHLQLVPLPLWPDGDSVPIGPALQPGELDAVSASPALPFAHSLVRFARSLRADNERAPRRMFEAYRSMLGVLQGQALPYNLLATDDWMLLVPRSREHVLGMSINALGFAGALLVRNDDELRAVKQEGPMSILRSAGFPPGMLGD